MLYPLLAIRIPLHISSRLINFALLSLVRSLRSLSVDLRLERGLGILLPVRTRDAGQELSNLLLIDLVLRVLASGDVLSQRRATSEDAQVRKRAGSSPVPPAASAVRSPRIQSDPDSLLSSKVRVTGELPETSGVEAALKLGASVALRRLGGLLVGGFGFVVVPLLLVGDESCGDQSDEEAGDGDFDGAHSWVEARVHEEEVGWGGDSEEQYLKNLLAGADKIGEQ